VYAYFAKWFSINGPLSIPPNHDGHVPMHFWILALFYRLFGESPFTSHIVSYIFSSISAFFTYLIGKEIYNKKVGIFASLLLFFSPVFFSITSQALIESTFLAFVLMTIYFSEVKKNKIAYLLSATLMVLTKEPGIIIVGGIVIYKILKKHKIKEIILYLLPISVMFIWYYWQYLNTGYFGFPATEKGLKLLFLQSSYGEVTNPIMFLSKLMTQIYQLTFWNYKWLLTIPLLFFVFKERKIKEFLLVIAFVFIIFFSVITSFLPRYLLPIYPIFFIFSAKSLNYFKKEYIVLLIIILFISCYRYNWGLKGIIQDPIFHTTLVHPKIITSVYNGELSLDYIDTVTIEKSAIDFLFENYSNTKIAAKFPLVTYRGLGYIDVGYREWIKNNITITNISDAELVVYESVCRNCWDELKGEPIATYKSNNKLLLILKQKNQVDSSNKEE